MKAANITIFIHVPSFKTPALSLCDNFKALAPKIFRYRLTKEQQFGSTQGYYLQQAAGNQRDAFCKRDKRERHRAGK